MIGQNEAAVAFEQCACSGSRPSEIIQSRTAKIA